MLRRRLRSYRSPAARRRCASHAQPRARTLSSTSAPRARDRECARLGRGGQARPPPPAPNQDPASASLPAMVKTVAGGFFGSSAVELRLPGVEARHRIDARLRRRVVEVHAHAAGRSPGAGRSRLRASRTASNRPRQPVARVLEGERLRGHAGRRPPGQEIPRLQVRLHRPLPVGRRRGQQRIAGEIGPPGVFDGIRLELVRIREDVEPGRQSRRGTPRIRAPACRTSGSSRRRAGRSRRAPGADGAPPRSARGRGGCEGGPAADGCRVRSRRAGYRRRRGRPPPRAGGARGPRVRVPRPR